jgi:hypothetical protein
MSFGGGGDCFERWAPKILARRRLHFGARSCDLIFAATGGGMSASAESGPRLLSLRLAGVDPKRTWLI